MIFVETRCVGNAVRTLVTRLAVLSLLLAVAAVGCTANSQPTVTPTEPPRPTRSVPEQPPVSPFDLISTVFPATPTPTALPVPVSTVIERAGGLPILPNPTAASIFRITPTPFVAAPGQTVFDVVVPINIQPVYGGGSVWFPDAQFVVRTDLTGERTGTFQVARSGPISIAFGVDHVWVLDAGEGELRKVTTEGETVARVPAPFGDVLTFNAGKVWVYSRTTERLTSFDLDGEQTGTFQIDATPGTFTISDDSLWVWRGTELLRISMENEVLSTWEVPEYPTESPSATPMLHVVEGQVWLTGYSYSEIARLDVAIGRALAIPLLFHEELEFVPRDMLAMGAVVLENSVWISYPRWRVPLDEFGSANSQFRRVEVFDLEGGTYGVLALEEPFLEMTLTYMAEPDEVWILRSKAPGASLFQRFKVTDVVQ